MFLTLEENSKGFSQECSFSEWLLSSQCQEMTQSRTAISTELSAPQRRLAWRLLKLLEWGRGPALLPRGYPHWPYLRRVVRDTLEDPAHGGRVQGEIGQQLHTLGHQLVLDSVSMDLQGTKGASERRESRHTRKDSQLGEPAGSCELAYVTVSSMSCHRVFLPV